MKRTAAAMLVRALPAVATLALALVTARAVGRAMMPRMGDAIARQVAAAAAALPGPIDSMGVEAAAVVPAPPGEAPVAAPSARPHPVRLTAASKLAPRAALSTPATTTTTTTTTATIDIPAERLAPLTEKQLRRLHAVDVIGADGRSAGARLVGFGALGLGLNDDDVVTSIDGHATPDVNSALAAALKAYGSGADRTHATVMRGDRMLRVVVHVPRAAKPAAEDVETRRP